MPSEAWWAELLCSVGERFGTPPHEVARWPARSLRMLTIDALVRKERRAKESANGQ